MKKIALILCFVLLTSLLFTGCKEETLVGTWYGKLDLGNLSEEMFSEVSEDFKNVNYSGLEIGMIYEFSEDGTYKMYLDKETFQGFSDAMLKKLRKPLLAYLGALADELGVNLSDVLTSKGMSEDEVLKGMIESVDVIGVLGNVDAELYYRTDGDKLYSADNPEALSKATFYIKYDLSGNNLMFTTNSREEEGKDAASRDILWEILKETKFKRK